MTNSYRGSDEPAAETSNVGETRGAASHMGFCKNHKGSKHMQARNETSKALVLAGSWL